MATYLNELIHSSLRSEYSLLLVRGLRGMGPIAGDCVKFGMGMYNCLLILNYSGIQRVASP